jgi:hypothetical protein
VNQPSANENWPRHRGAAKLEATKQRSLCAGRRLIGCHPRSLRPYDELVGYPAGKPSRSPADHVTDLIRHIAADAEADRPPGRDRESRAARHRPQAGSKRVTAR